MHASGQLSFSDIEQANKKKITRRERFLGQLEQLLPRDDLLALSELHYPTSGRPGQQPLPLASLRQFCRFELDRGLAKSLNRFLCLALLSNMLKGQEKCIIMVKSPQKLDLCAVTG